VVAAEELPVPRHDLHDRPRRQLLVRRRLEGRRPPEAHLPLEDRRLSRLDRLLEDLPEVAVEGVG
jgi:hypothetical protein